MKSNLIKEINKIELDEGDILVLKGRFCIKAREAVKHILKNKGFKNLVFFLNPDDEIFTISTKEMNSQGWYKKVPLEPECPPNETVKEYEIKE